MVLCAIVERGTSRTVISQNSMLLQPSLLLASVAGGLGQNKSKKKTKKTKRWSKRSRSLGSHTSNKLQKTWRLSGEDSAVNKNTWMYVVCLKTFPGTLPYL